MPRRSQRRPTFWEGWADCLEGHVTVWWSTSGPLPDLVACIECDAPATVAAQIDHDGTLEELAAALERYD